jgi:hypothetical protein
MDIKKLCDIIKIDCKKKGLDEEKTQEIISNYFKARSKFLEKENEDLKKIILKK